MNAIIPISIPVARPKLPSADAVMLYMKRVDETRWYSNHGPLSTALQGRLARLWGVSASSVALLANGTSALTLALVAAGARPGSRCLMPSWTFVASAGAVTQAGLIPHFVDVEENTWVPDLNQVRDLASRLDIGAILVVAPFGAPLDLAAWDALRRETGVPVVIDGAAAFDTLSDEGPMTAGEAPVAVSLHATKVMGIGEGGALICRDQAVMERVRRLAQFGFLGTREALVPGANSKISEYTAAVGLAGMDAWARTRTRWASLTRTYADALPAQVRPSPDFGTRWVSSTLVVRLERSAEDVAQALASEGIGTVRWWGVGCHAQPAYRDCPAEALPATERLARTTLGLPFWQDLPPASVEKVCRTLGRVLAQPAPIPALATYLS